MSARICSAFIPPLFPTEFFINLFSYFFSDKDNEWTELQIWKERERLETSLLEKCYQKTRLVPR